MTNIEHVRRALNLAAAAPRVSPRPPVGAVIVDDRGEVVGEGATTPVPGPHAEVVALREAGPRAAGSTVYVSLEPCSHHGETPPCADALISARVRAVVTAMVDPNPLVGGTGIERLRAAGIDVIVGPCEQEARRLIEPFTVWVTSGRPRVTLKLASTLDGKVAAADGSSQWITGDDARAEVHELRRRADGVLVGAGTVAADDPQLTCRLPGYAGPQPCRVVVDSSGRTSPQARIFDDAAPTLVLTTPDVPDEVRESWVRAGADVVELPRGEGGVHLGSALGALGRMGMCDLLCEGGPTLAGAAVHAGLVDRFLLYLAPKLVGGDAPGLLSSGVKTIADAWSLDVENITRVGTDIRIDARPGRA